MRSSVSPPLRDPRSEGGKNAYFSFLTNSKQLLIVRFFDTIKAIELGQERGTEGRTDVKVDIFM